MPKLTHINKWPMSLLEFLVMDLGPPIKDQALIVQQTAALCLILSRWARARPSHLALPVNLERDLSEGRRGIHSPCLLYTGTLYRWRAHAVRNCS